MLKNVLRRIDAPNIFPCSQCPSVMSPIHCWRGEEVLRQYDRYEKVLEQDFDLSPQADVVDQMLLARESLAGSSS